MIFWRICCALINLPHRILVDRLTCSRDEGRWSWWSWRHWSCSQHPEAEVTTLMMMESLPLPRQNTDSATLAHSLEGSFRLLHFIVNSVQALFYVIELFCNHQTALDWKTWVVDEEQNIFFLTYSQQPDVSHNISSSDLHTIADKFCLTPRKWGNIKAIGIIFQVHWRQFHLVLPPWSSSATKVLMPASFDCRDKDNNGKNVWITWLLVLLLIVRHKTNHCYKRDS